LARLGGYRLHGLTHNSVVEYHPQKVTVEGSTPSTLKNAKTDAAVVREGNSSKKVSKTEPFGELGASEARKATGVW
jgi:hypothetical protein